jgi:hypothetical protein
MSIPEKPSEDDDGCETEYQVDLLDSRVGASLDNPLSFWFSRLSLSRALVDTGFTSVCECHVPLEPTKPANRTTIIAAKGEPVMLSAYPWVNNKTEEEIRLGLHPHPFGSIVVGSLGVGTPWILGRCWFPPLTLERAGVDNAAHKPAEALSVWLSNALDSAAQTRPTKTAVRATSALVRFTLRKRVLIAMGGDHMTGTSGSMACHRDSRASCLLGAFQNHIGSRTRRRSEDGVVQFISRELGNGELSVGTVYIWV